MGNIFCCVCLLWQAKVANSAEMRAQLYLVVCRGGEGGSLKIHAHSKSVAYFRAPQGPFATRSNEHIQKFY